MDDLLFKIESWQNTTSKHGYNIYLSAKDKNGKKIYARAYIPTPQSAKFENEPRAHCLDGKLMITIRRQRPDPQGRQGGDE